jgi:hypothetical protein
MQHDSSEASNVTDDFKLVLIVDANKEKLKQSVKPFKLSDFGRLCARPELRN